jgi:hypothetical protein
LHCPVGRVLRQHSRRRRYQCLGNVFRYHAEETAKAHILNKHPGPMSASSFAALGTRFPPVFLGPGRKR